MAGSRCAGSACTCRERGANEAEAAPPPDGMKRLELRMSAEGGVAAVELSGLGTLAVAGGPEVCAYIDVPAGSVHDVDVHGQGDGQGAGGGAAAADRGVRPEGTLLVRPDEHRVRRAGRALRPLGRRRLGRVHAPAQARAAGSMRLGRDHQAGLGHERQRGRCATAACSGTSRSGSRWRSRSSPPRARPARRSASRNDRAEPFGAGAGRGR